MISIEFVEELNVLLEVWNLKEVGQLESRTFVKLLGAENLPRRSSIKSLDSMLVRGRMNDNLYHAAVPHGRF